MSIRYAVHLRRRFCGVGDRPAHPACRPLGRRHVFGRTGGPPGGVRFTNRGGAAAPWASFERAPAEGISTQGERAGFHKGRARPVFVTGDSASFRVRFGELHNSPEDLRNRD